MEAGTPDVMLGIYDGLHGTDIARLRGTSRNLRNTNDVLKPHVASRRPTCWASRLQAPYTGQGWKISAVKQLLLSREQHARVANPAVGTYGSMVNTHTCNVLQ